MRKEGFEDESAPLSRKRLRRAARREQWRNEEAGLVLPSNLQLRLLYARHAYMCRVLQMFGHLRICEVVDSPVSLGCLP
jgi:hypothetical protein